MELSLPADEHGPWIGIQKHELHWGRKTAQHLVCWCCGNMLDRWTHCLVVLIMLQNKGVILTQSCPHCHSFIFFDFVTYTFFALHFSNQT